MLLGPVNCSMLTLEGLDSAYDPSKYSNVMTKKTPKEDCMHNVIDWICITNSTTCALIPDIQKLVDTKWECFGRRLFMRSFALHMVRTLAVSLSAVLINDEPLLHFHGNKYSMEGVWSLVLYSTAGFTIVISVIYELPCLLQNGWQYWGYRKPLKSTGNEVRYHICHIRGTAVFDKVCMTVTLASFLLVWLFKPFLAFSGCYELLVNENNLCDSLSWSSQLFMTICVISVWVYVFYFLMGIEIYGPMVISIYRIMTNDVPFFFTFYILLLVAFASALSMMFVDSGTEPVTIFLFSFIRFIQITVGMEHAADEVWNSHEIAEGRRFLFEGILTLYYLVVLIMVNLLIAILSSTYSNLSGADATKARLIMEKHNRMCGMVCSG